MKTVMKLPMVHRLKTDPEPFAALVQGRKHTELRKDDRKFAVGDVLLLEEYDPLTKKHTGRHRLARVTHLVRWDEPFGVDALQPHHVAMSVRIFREPRSI